MKISFGAKADNLKLLTEASFRVPPFYVIPSGTDLSKPAVRKQVLSEFEDWLKAGKVVSAAVRSSSTQEDTREKSFAGQFTTILDVQPSGFIAALKEVFDSKQSQAYSKSTGVVHAIVQAFIEPEVSGVVFSVNPANGNHEFVINAAAGRGTKVVEGHEAQQYFVDRLDPDQFAMRSEEETATDLLTEADVSALTDVTAKIETLFGVPQDIEWALKSGELYILQARPITHISHFRLWDSSNLSESFPGIVLPLTFSIAKKGYFLGYQAQAYSGGMSWYEIEAHHRTFDAMIGIFNGRMYYNLLNWYRYISLFPGNTRNQQFLDEQIATQGAAAYQSPARHTKGFRIQYYSKILYRVMFFKRELQKFYDTFEKFDAELSRLPKGGDAQIIMQRYSHIEQTIIPQFGRSLDNDFLVMTYHGWLKRLLTKWLPDRPFEKNSIIGSITGVESVQQALSLHHLAEGIKADATARPLLEKANYQQLEAYLKGTELYPKIQTYLEVFGHRFAQDQKIEASNPMLEPMGIYKVLKTYAMLDGSTVEQRIKASQQASHYLEKQVIRRLDPHERLMYRWLLNRLKRHLRIREKNRLLRGKVWGYLRELFPQVGRALVKEDLLQQPDDIYYLEIEEVYQVMQGSLIINDLPERIAARRQAYENYANIEMPERFITTALPSLEKVTLPPAQTGTIKSSLSGLISSPGTVEGVALVLTDPVIPNQPYDILVANHTDPGWTPLIALAKGVIVQHGGMLSHAAIVTRELGIPSIIGVENVTKLIKTGMRVRINTQTATVEILETLD